MCDGSWYQLHHSVHTDHLLVSNFKLTLGFNHSSFKRHKSEGNPHSLTNLPCNDIKRWKEKIFECGDKAIKKYHIECLILMLSLNAAEIIIWRVVEGEIEWWRSRVAGRIGMELHY